MKRYEALAADIEAAIRAGVLREGDRLPSVRTTSSSRGASASTVFQAYYLLEARGLVRARDRSGYYVTPQPRGPLPELEGTSKPPAASQVVDISESVFHILGSASRRDVVPFGSAFPSPLLFPLARLGQAMAQSVQAMDPWSTVDDLSPGNATLRRHIAQRYLADGMTVPADEIVVTNGALEALNLCLSTVARPGDKVVVESPTFYAALQALERLGLQAVEVPTHPREGIDLDALEKAIARHKPRACWLMTTFQNPLGSLMPADKKKALVKLLAGKDIPLIEDDVYAELYFGAKRPLPAKAFDETGIVMHCSSFSKCLAPGYRIGWAAPGRHALAVARQKLTTTLGASAPAQQAIAAYLGKGGYDRHLRQLRRTLETQQAGMLEAVRKYFPEGTRATRPQGGYFIWAELPGNADALRVHREALALGISVAPGPIFSASKSFRNCLRLNSGHAWAQKAERALSLLGRLARDAAGPN